jgi:hypothetical protein
MSRAAAARCQGSLLAILGTRIVRIVYSDESGVGSKKNEPITVVTAIMMNMDDHWTDVESELRRILARTPDCLLGDHRELKGQILYSAVRKNIGFARDMLTQILAILVKNPTEIFYGAVDRVGYDNRPATHRQTVTAKKATWTDRAFDDCLARVHNYARASLPHEQILWISDHQSDKEREKSIKTGRNLAESLNFRGWDLMTLTRNRPRSREPLRIADSIYFGHSHESLALQLADVCCSTITLHLLENFYEWRPNVEPFYEIIRLQVINAGTPPIYMAKDQPGKGANSTKRKV